MAADGSTATVRTASGRARRRVRAFLLLLGPVVVGAVALHVYLNGGRIVSTDNAYVKAAKTTVSPEIAGRVVEVAVRENEVVKAGQRLFKIDDEPLRIAVTKAEAQLQAVRLELDALRASYRQKREELKLAETNVPYAEREFRRQSELAERKVATEARLDEARNRLDVVRLQVSALRQDLARLVAALAGDADTPAERHPKFLEVRAELDEARLNLRRAEIKAPDDGIVSRVDSVRPGDFVRAGAAAFSIVSSRKIWIEANLKETDITNLVPGQKAKIRVDAFPDATWTATVESIGAATGAEFSILPPQNATGNWIKVVQRVPVRLLIDDAADRPQLRAGLSVVVDIDTGIERSLPNLIKAALAKVGGGR
ncbi:MAG: HlyD family secretion protein [Alphaproteobacteria bacterium]|nr:HlyD family secretion protein [Alphaproteobacteria bacterium]